MEQIWSWNKHYPQTPLRSVPKLFKEQVEAHPEAQAVCSWDGNLTYGDLGEFSTRLAHYLIDLGMGGDSFIPLYFERSLWAIVAMFAVVKVGGAVVSLDPAQPKARTEWILSQTGATLVLTSHKYHHLWHG